MDEMENIKLNQNFVYIIKGERNRFYCGMTKDLITRIQAHNKGECISTRWNKPYVLKWIYETDSRIKARFVEVYIKEIGVEKFMRKLRDRVDYKNHMQLLAEYTEKIERSKEINNNKQPI